MKLFNQAVIRIFLSSTFQDMEAERDALHEGAFRVLREHCESRGFQLHVVDLRWGVSDEAAWDQRTERLCLQEIERCREITPRPNFVALVGQRYGWRPLPLELTIDDWTLLHSLSDGDLPLLEDWYRLDRNNSPTVYRLRPRESDIERDPESWARNVEAPLKKLFRQAHFEDMAELSSYALRDAEVSLTEKEIRLGAENASQHQWEAFVYFRQLVDATPEELGAPWVDLSPDGQIDRHSLDMLQKLEDRLVARNDVSTQSYPTRFVMQEGKKQVEEQALQDLNRMVQEDLLRIIDNQISSFQAQNALERELQRHREFARQRQANYVSRPREENIALAYLSSKGERPLVLHGASGAGKTALMSKLQSLVTERFPEATCVTRFIGATSESSTLRSLVRSVHNEIARAVAAEEKSEMLQADPRVSFRVALSLGRKEQPIFVLMDALDQLTPDDQALTGGWIPAELPEYCRLIVTCMTGQEEIGQLGAGVLPALRGRFNDEDVVEIKDPSIMELREMLESWLDYHKRKLTSTQLKVTESKLAACPRPLFIRVLVGMAISWGEDIKLDDIPTSVPEIIERYLEFIESERTHGRTLVRKTLGLLEASRAGLTEIEIVELLSRDQEVQEEFNSTSHHQYKDVHGRLPPVIWSRLLFDLEFFLGNSTAAGVNVFNFYHRQLALGVKRRYLDPYRKSMHQQLATYFGELPDWHDEAAVAPNKRRVYELSYQLRQLGTSEAVEELQVLLVSTSWVEAKIKAGLAPDLLNDFYQMETLESSNLEPLVAFFSKQYLQEDAPLARCVGPDDLHSFFAYRGEAIFYHSLQKLLTSLSDRDETTYARRLCSRAKIDLGGMLRRQRDFEVAGALLSVVNEDNTGLEQKDLGTAWYEIGYLHYLQDDYHEAAQALHKSVELAKAGGDTVGATASRIIETWALYFEDPSNAHLEKIINETQDAVVFFEDRQKVDPRAFRWLMNVLIHHANAEYLAGNPAGMNNSLRNLHANPWIREHRSQSWLLPLEARYSMASGRAEEAVSLWEENLQNSPIQPSTEAGAWSYLDYGLALIACGKRHEAIEVFKKGLDLNKFGASNAYWQKRISEELRSLGG